MTLVKWLISIFIIIAMGFKPIAMEKAIAHDVSKLILNNR